MLFFYFKRSNFGGLRETAKRIGLGNNIDIKLSSLDKADAAKGTQCFAINTDLQAELEMPSIRKGSDMLQGKLSKFFISIVLELVLVLSCVPSSMQTDHTGFE